jgi:hypothetical protein
MNKILILAGTDKQAMLLARWHGMPPTAWRYVSSPDRLLGLRNGVLWLFGTWRNRHDFRECIDVAKANGLMIFTIEDDRYIGGSA